MSRATVDITSVQYLAGEHVEMFRKSPSCLCSEDGTLSTGSIVSLTISSYFLQENQTGNYFYANGGCWATTEMSPQRILTFCQPAEGQGRPVSALPVMTVAPDAMPFGVDHFPLVGKDVSLHHGMLQEVPFSQDVSQ